ncbi:hypothetical protein ATCC90586_001024 [Pythium insidiosum]|nr:hypothetical protein ATCC90586_001024 [Pythium insidiosum]
MTTSEAHEPSRTLSAAEKRAARRAKVLQGGERRLKLLTGEVSTLKEKDDRRTIEQAMDESVDELLQSTDVDVDGDVDGDGDGDAAVESEEPPMAVEESSVNVKFPPRVDPAQRRRDAAARRRKKESMVQEMLGDSAVAHATSTPAAAAEGTTMPAQTLPKEIAVKGATVDPAFSRHTVALQLQSAEEKLIVLAIVVAALYFAVTMDLHNVMTGEDGGVFICLYHGVLTDTPTVHLMKDVILGDPRVISYRQLFQQGVSVDSIRQQMQRENVEPVLMQQIERIMTVPSQQTKLSSSVFASVLDLPGSLLSLVQRPPVIAGVLALRVIVGLLGGAVHAALHLPDVKNPQEDDLGFVFNLLLSSRPVLKAYVAKARKSVDDLVLFLWVLVLGVATRAISAAHWPRA